MISQMANGGILIEPGTDNPRPPCTHGCDDDCDRCRLIKDFAAALAERMKGKDGHAPSEN